MAKPPGRKKRASRAQFVHFDGEKFCEARRRFVADRPDQALKLYLQALSVVDDDVGPLDMDANPPATQAERDARNELAVTYHTLSWQSLEDEATSGKALEYAERCLAITRYPTLFLDHGDGTPLVDLSPSDAYFNLAFCLLAHAQDPGRTTDPEEHDRMVTRAVAKAIEGMYRAESAHSGAIAHLRDRLRGLPGFRPPADFEAFVASPLGQAVLDMLANVCEELDDSTPAESENLREAVRQVLFRPLDDNVVDILGRQNQIERQETLARLAKDPNDPPRAAPELPKCGDCPDIDLPGGRRGNVRRLPARGAGHDNELLDAVGDFVERVFGPCIVFHDTKPERVHADVFLTVPNEKWPHHVLVSCGMSQLPMTVPEAREDHAFAELVMFLPPGWDLSSRKALNSAKHAWPAFMVRSLAHLPHRESTWLADGHSVGQKPSFGKFTPQCDALICLPLWSNRFHEYARLRVGDRLINFHHVLLAYPDEIRYKISRGYERTLSRILSVGGDETYRPGRPDFTKCRIVDRAGRIVP